MSRRVKNRESSVVGENREVGMMDDEMKPERGPIDWNVVVIVCVVSAILGETLLFGLDVSGIDTVLSSLPEGVEGIFAPILFVIGSVMAGMPLLAVVGIVLGVGILIRGGLRGGWRGKGAIAIVGLVVCTAYLANIPWSIVKAEREERAVEACRMNLTALARAMHEYVEENDQSFPPAEGWCEGLEPYLDDAEVFVCPAAENSRCSYAYNAALEGLKYSDLATPENTVAIFETDKGWDAAGGRELLTAMPRHREGDVFAFADGSQGYVARQAEDRPIWDLKVEKIGGE